MKDEKKTHVCVGCGKVARKGYDLGVFLGDWAQKGRYCMECLRKVYAGRPR